jgi:hypothetical protein
LYSWLHSNALEKIPNRSNLIALRFLLGMRAMKYLDFIAMSETHTGAITFNNGTSASNQKSLDISPNNGARYRIGENGRLGCVVSYGLAVARDGFCC